MNQTHLGLQGRITSLEVLQGGRTVWSDPQPQRNLLLNQGLDKIKNTLIADLFKYAVKGTGTTATKEVVATSNSFTWTSADTTITRSAGTRNFTSADEGKLIRFLSNGATATILTYLSATTVTVDRPRVGSTITADDIVLYAVNQTGMATEQSTFTAGDGSTEIDTQVGGAGDEINLGSGVTPNYDDAFAAIGLSDGSSLVGYRMFFPVQGIHLLIKEYVSNESLKFDADDPLLAGQIGAGLDLSGNTTLLIYPPKSLTDGSTAARSDTYGQSTGDNATTDVAATRTLRRTFLFAPEVIPQTYLGIGAVIAGTAVSKSGGSGTFSALDVGKLIVFDNGSYSTITAYIDATHITIADDLGSHTSTFCKLSPYKTYNEIGFSDQGVPGNNLNIRVVLSAGVKVAGAIHAFDSATAGVVGIELLPAQQLKVSYELDVTASPATVVTSIPPSVNDSGNQMSANKNGKAVIENLLLSSIADNGATDGSQAVLEPGSTDANCALLPVGTVPINFGSASPIIRKGTGIATTPLVSLVNFYETGDYFVRRKGTFGLTEGLGASWRAVAIWDLESGLPGFTHVFLAAPGYTVPVNQAKDSNHTLIFTFKTSWDRNLS